MVENIQGEDDAFTSRRYFARPPGGLGEVLNIACDMGFDIPDADVVWEEALLDETSGQEPQFLHLLRRNADQQKLELRLEETLESYQIQTNFGVLTRKEEIVKRSEAVANATRTLELVLHHKHLIATRLQQPFTVSCIPVETEYQREFARVLAHVAADCGKLMESMEHIRWAKDCSDPISNWKDVLKPVPPAIAALCRYHEGLVALQAVTAKIEASICEHQQESSPISLEHGLVEFRQDDTEAESMPTSPEKTHPLFDKKQDECENFEEHRTPPSHSSLSFIPSAHFGPPIGLMPAGSTCGSPLDERTNLVAPLGGGNDMLESRMGRNASVDQSFDRKNRGYDTSTPSVASSNSPQFFRRGEGR